MRLDLSDRLCRIDSPVHRFPAAVKLPAALAAILAVVVIPSERPWLLAVAGGVLLVLAALSRVPPRYLAGRILMLEPFVVGVALLSLLQPHGGRVFLTLLTRSTLCLFAVVLLSATTPFSEILHVLRRARVPSILVTVLALMYRYLFVLLDEMGRLKRARASRTFVSGRAGRWRTLASVAGQLFVRASDRGERIYAAMRARGWR